MAARPQFDGDGRLVAVEREDSVERLREPVAGADERSRRSRCCGSPRATRGRSRATISPTTTDVISETIRARPHMPRLAATPAFALVRPALPRNRPERSAMVAMGTVPGAITSTCVAGGEVTADRAEFAASASRPCGRRRRGWPRPCRPPSPPCRRLARPGHAADRGARGVLRAAESVLRAAALPRARGLRAGRRRLGPLLVALPGRGGLLRGRRPVCLGLLCHVSPPSGWLRPCGTPEPGRPITTTARFRSVVRLGLATALVSALLVGALPASADAARALRAARRLRRARHAGQVRQGRHPEDRAAAARRNVLVLNPGTSAERRVLRAARAGRRRSGRRAGRCGRSSGARTCSRTTRCSTAPSAGTATPRAAVRLLPRLDHRLERHDALPARSPTPSVALRAASGGCASRSRTCGGWSSGPSAAAAHVVVLAATRSAARSRPPTPPGTSAAGRARAASPGLVFIDGGSSPHADHARRTPSSGSPT